MCRHVWMSLMLTICTVGQHRVFAQRIVWDVEGHCRESSAARRIDSAGVEFQGDVGRITWEKLIAWGAATEYRSGVATVLIDGSILVSGPGRIDPNRWTVDAGEHQWLGPSVWTRIECARSSVAGVLFRASSVLDELDRLLEKLLTESHEHDQLYLSNGDVVEGDWVDWTYEKRPSIVKMQTPSGLLSIDENQCLAVALARRTNQPRPPQCVLGWSDGSLVHVYRIMSDAKGWTFEINGGSARIDSQRIDQLCYVRSGRAPVRYLSELTASGYRYVPLFSLEWPYRLNRNVLGYRIRSTQGWYDVGIGLHATCRLAYPVPDKAVRFQTQVALDRSSGNLGSAVLRVYVQKGAAFHLAATTEVFTAETPPISISIDVQDAQQLALIVDAADGWDIGDRVNLILPCFVFSSNDVP